jgi:hypothetical protein
LRGAPRPKETRPRAWHRDLSLSDDGAEALHLRK